MQTSGYDNHAVSILDVCMLLIPLLLLLCVCVTLTAAAIHFTLLRYM